MARRNTYDKDIRKITKLGDSYALTLPIDIIRELGWKKRQKVVVKKRGKGVVIVDWE
jgi:antitoxin component of MazEF toxin-antitoxin module